MTNKQLSSKARIALVVLIALVVNVAVAFTSSSPTGRRTSSLGMAASEEEDLSRRSLLMGTAAAGFILSGFALSMAAFPQPVQAKPDCMTDCVKNCKVRKEYVEIAKR